MKFLIEAGGDLDLDAGLATQSDASERIFASEDMLEELNAFLDKRPRGIGATRRTSPKEVSA